MSITTFQASPPSDTFAVGAGRPSRIRTMTLAEHLDRETLLVETLRAYTVETARHCQHDTPAEYADFVNDLTEVEHGDAPTSVARQAGLPAVRLRRLHPLPRLRLHRPQQQRLPRLAGGGRARRHRRGHHPHHDRTRSRPGHVHRRRGQHDRPRVASATSSPGSGSSFSTPPTSRPGTPPTVSRSRC